MITKRIDNPTEAMQKLYEGKKSLQEGNIFSGIVALRDTLDAVINMKNVPRNEKKYLVNDINIFQQTLAISQEFNDLYGKVAFRDNDFMISHDFICQLIKIKEEEIADVLVNEEASQFLNLDYLSQEDQQTTKLMVSLVERGELSALRELVDAHDGLGSLVLSFYNETGISLRESGNFDKAIAGYKKALSLSPNDEHLYYNLARAYIESGQKENAETAISQAMQINPQFQEGLRLKKYISQWSS